jgi:hypothetical protein
MKHLLVTLFLFISFLGFGQSVSAPDSKSFIPSTTAQDASGFVLSGFSSTSTLLASISLITFPTGTTFYLNTTTGLTAASGFTLNGNKTRLVVTGTMDNINTALASLKINTGAVNGEVKLSVAATINPAGYYYNGVNGHFYKPVTNGVTYTAARAASLLTTFKGERGYLVTITSASENAFIYANVPQTNIWFAATDEVIDGTWVIDAGPEKGTVMKTSNGQLAGNRPGVYNNWAGGEPNGYNHGEDYAVTNWGGQSTWNDLSNNWNNPYIIEYGTWSNPDDATFTEFYTNSTSHTNGEVLTARFNFDFGGNVDETKFSTKANKYINNVWSTTTNTSKSLSGLGKVDITNDLDTAKISDGKYNGTTTPGQVEWCAISKSFSNGNTRILVDMRQIGSVSPSNISNLKILDVYNGPITYVSNDATWGQYDAPIDLPTKILTSTYFNTNFRGYGGYYGVSIDFTFTPSTSYKQHGIDLSYTNQTDLNTLYSNIVTVSDVYIAFKELSLGGLFENESGNEFTSGLQYMNADIDGNGVFNENDTYRLLQHLTGVKSLTQYSTLTYLMKLYSKSDYDAITKSNWNTKFNSTRSLFPFSLNTGTLNNTYNVNATWVGDVNLSHSALQSIGSVASNSIRSMSLATNSISTDIQASILTELANGKAYAYISLNPLQNELVGTQFQLNYDNSVLKFDGVEFKTKGSPTNFGTNKGTYVNIGSLITDGNNILDNTTEYRIIFTPIKNVSNILGLISVGYTDAVNRSGKQLKIKIN